MRAVTVDEVIAKWSGLPGGAERKNFPTFIYDLIDALDLPRPGPGVAGRLGDYEFEGTVQGGSAKQTGAGGSADLYKRGCFIMEAKQSWLPPREQRAPGPFDAADVIPLSPSGAAYDKMMIRAQAQAKNYAAHLPGEHPPAPFLLVCDVGRAFEVFYDTAGNGRGYGFYPDATGYRIPLARLADPDVQALFRDIWTNPAARDPSLVKALVTKQVSRDIAEVSKHLEETVTADVRQRGGDELAVNTAVEEGALYLMRLLFCMFAEDIGLLPEGRFTEFLKSCVSHTADFQTKVDFEYLNLGLLDLWKKMDEPGGDRASLLLRAKVRYFNGSLFRDAKVLPLGTNDVIKLIDAAERRWEQVEPAIFGTLLEQALSVKDRAKLGAHYTPRAYVERLVGATIMEVLNTEWAAAQETLTDPDTDAQEARAIAAAFHDRLAVVRVLDPACGTGNFLYVAMEAIERLEAQVIEVRRQLGDPARARVAPHQFLGLEKNPRAAKIAELVLWIGWLRFRIGNDPDSITDPVLASAANINFGRAGGYDAVLDEATGLIPDWPDAEFIVGNPPFIGKGAQMRAALGDEYVAALAKANPRVALSADFVMQWWERAANLLTTPGTPLRRFGFVTTNSITQTFNRRVIERYLAPPRDGKVARAQRVTEGAQPPATSFAEGPLHHQPSAGGPPPRAGEEQKLSLIFAIPDHPWTKASPDAAAVRIAITVAEAGSKPGRLLEVVSETALDSDSPDLQTVTFLGRLNADLTIGADATTVYKLRANEGLSGNGMLLAGRGFVLSAMEASHFRQKEKADTVRVIRRYIGGSEVVQSAKGRYVVDLFGYDERASRKSFPFLYQHLLETVRPKRIGNIKKYREREWWLFGENNPNVRSALKDLTRYIATVETAKHRIFVFVDADVTPDHMIVTVADDRPWVLGALSSAPHMLWSAWAGGTLEDRPRYTKSKTFDPFPFPDPTPDQRTAIADLAEELDATRKRVLAEVPRLTMTELYNLRAAWVAGTLTPAQRDRAVAAGAGIVAKLHDDLDAAVAAAYGWSWPLPPSEIVARLLTLNAERAAEEARGHVRWLRPDYQRPRFGRPGDVTEE